MNFITVMNQVFIIFTMLMIGFISRKKGIMNEELTKGISDLLLRVIMPLNVIASFSQNLPKEALSECGQILLFAMLIHAFSILIGKFLYRKCEAPTKKVMWYVTVFSNCGFMGYPVMESIFGSIGVFYAAVYLVAFHLFTWTFGQALFTGEKGLRSILNVMLSPAIVSIFIGFLILIFEIKLPVFAGKSISMIGSTTTPLAMLVVGSMLSEIELKDMFSGFYIYYGTAVRLIVLPVVTLLVLRSIGISGNVLTTCYLLTAMPAAASTAIFAGSFNGNTALASRVIFLSTILSIITIPLATLLL